MERAGKDAGRASIREGVVQEPARQGPEQGAFATPPRRAPIVLQAAAIVALALTLNLAGNGRNSLWDRDEPRYAGCTREMIARGDWILPSFNGEPRFHKPVLIYWLMRFGFAVGGDNPFGARLVSALAGTATSLVVFALGRRMFGPRAGFLASLMLTTAPIMVIESKLATTDATLALFLTASQWCLWELSRAPSRRVAATFWVLMGLATLTKGPVGLALIGSAGVISWWWGGPAIVWRRLDWRWGVPIFLLVTTPWYAAVGILSHGEFYRFAVGKQIAERVVSGVEQHGGFPGYYLVTSLLTFHPWSALLPVAILGAWSRRKKNPAFGFLLGWVIGPLILLECVQTKLVHYYLPAYPACALLVAWLVEGLLRDEVNLRRWPLGRLGLNLLVGVGIGLAAVFVAGAVVLPTTLRAPLLVTAGIVGVGTVWGALRFQHAATVRAVGGLAATWAVSMLLISTWLVPAAEPYRLPRLVSEKLVRLSDAHHSQPVLLAFQEPSMVYTMHRTAPMIRRWARLYAEVDRNGSVVTAISHPIETAEFVKHPDLLVDIREVVEGFNLNKGKNETLLLAVVRRKPSVVKAPTDPGVTRVGVESPPAGGR
jgi:4-amino-4-deoxy-L-arabinose transferase-like glycosyltransferase